METKRFCKPFSADKSSTWEQVAKDIATLLISLERINRQNIESGAITYECQNFSDRIVDTLRSEGWAITFSRKTSSGKTVYHVVPPKNRS
jgi:hypothetical protein